MYDNNTKTYRAVDATGSYEWIFDSMEYTPEFATMSASDISAWVAQIIDQSKDNDIIDVTIQADDKDDSWLDDKLAEIEDDYAYEYESVETAIRAWLKEHAASD